jgi:hypothetical protein
LPNNTCLLTKRTIVRFNFYINHSKRDFLGSALIKTVSALSGPASGGQVLFLLPT